MSVPILKTNRAAKVKATEKLKTDVEQLQEAAIAEGFGSIKDLVREKFPGWSDFMYLSELYDNFLNSIQQSASKEPYAKGVWNVDSTFIEYMALSLKEIKFLLDEIKWKKVEQFPSYAGIIKLLPNMKDVPSGVGSGLTIEDYEFYEEIIRKGEEVIKECMSNDTLITDFLRDYWEYRKEHGDPFKASESVIDAP